MTWHVEITVAAPDKSHVRYFFFGDEKEARDFVADAMKEPFEASSPFLCLRDDAGDVVEAIRRVAVLAVSINTMTDAEYVAYANARHVKEVMR